MSLVDVAERLAAVDRSAIALDAARCLHSLARSSACEACFTICPVRAIAPGEPPSLDGDRCERCLACLTVCPVGTFSADDAVPALLNAAARMESSEVELLCSRNPVPEKGLSANGTGLVVKGCLAGLGAGAYVALVPFGLERIVVRTGACSSCQWAVLEAEIHAQVEHARHLLSAWNKAEAIAVSGAVDPTTRRPVLDADNPPLSRRDLFRMLARQGQVAMARAMENGVRAPGRRPGRDRLRMLGGAAHLLAPGECADVRLGELGFAVVSISDACSACGACARACPTDALTCKKDDQETTFILQFSPGACIGCDLCTRVCVPLAVTVNHDPAFGDIFGVEPVLLVEAELVKCESCGAPTAKRSAHQLCDLCEFRRTHPFGSGRLMRT